MLESIPIFKRWRMTPALFPNKNHLRQGRRAFARRPILSPPRFITRGQIPHVFEKLATMDHGRSVLKPVTNPPPTSNKSMRLNSREGSRIFSVAYLWVSPPDLQQSTAQEATLIPRAPRRNANRAPQTCRHGTGEGHVLQRHRALRVDLLAGKHDQPQILKSVLILRGAARTHARRCTIAVRAGGLPWGAGPCSGLHKDKHLERGEPDPPVPATTGLMALQVAIASGVPVKINRQTVQRPLHTHPVLGFERLAGKGDPGQFLDRK